MINIVCDRCIKDVISRGEPAGYIHYWISAELDFFDCVHLNFVEVE